MFSFGPEHTRIKNGQQEIGRTPLGARHQSPARGQIEKYRIIKYCCVALLFLMAVIPISHAQTQQSKPAGAAPTPEPAVPAILAAFDKYEVVAMPQGHGMQDLNDFILSLIRNPAFSEKVNDIEFECGNSLYQPVFASQARFVATFSFFSEDPRKNKNHTFFESIT
jgi:hypothetical protein